MASSGTVLDVQTAFDEALAQQAEACTGWLSDKGAWTRVMTRALVQLGSALYPGCLHAAKGHCSPRQRSEHLSLDVVLYGGPLEPIVFAAEHENTPRMAVLEYTAWKLLNVSAPTRVAVGYWRSLSRDADTLRTHEELCAGIRSVVTRFAGQSLIVIAADRSAEIGDLGDLRAAFVTTRIG